MNTHDPEGTPFPAVRPARGSPALAGVMTFLGGVYALAMTLSVLVMLRGRVDTGVIGVLLCLTTAPVAFAAAHLALTRSQPEWSRGIEGRLDQIAGAMRNLTDHATLSDDARRVLNRRAERDALSRAIEEDVAAQNWDAAIVLVNDLSERFGHRAEAEAFRTRIDEARRQTREREISAAIEGLDAMILERRWDDAQADAARIGRLYPGSPRVDGLSGRVRSSRERYKQDLEAHFQQAFREQRTDEALETLRELDFYLTPEEAEPYREMARGVIGRARDEMGSQFRAAVQDRRWREAERLGQTIINQFPNSKMAGEVRDVIAGIRDKAG